MGSCMAGSVSIVLINVKHSYRNSHLLGSLALHSTPNLNNVPLLNSLVGLADAVPAHQMKAACPTCADPLGFLEGWHVPLV